MVRQERKHPSSDRSPDASIESSLAELIENAVETENPVEADENDRDLQGPDASTQNPAELELMELGLLDPEPTETPAAKQSTECQPETDCSVSDVWPGTLLEDPEGSRAPSRQETEPEMGRVLDAVESTTQLLRCMQDQLAELSSAVAQHATVDSPTNISPVIEGDYSIDAIDGLHDRIAELEKQVRELEQQNGDLAAQVAATHVRETVSGTEGDSMFWEQRKALILKQLEDDPFDEDDCPDSSKKQSGNVPGSVEHNVDAADEANDEIVAELTAELDQRNREIAKRDEELQELREVLEQQSTTLQDGVSIGAAGIASMLDSDDLIREERERLQMLQLEWEEKFRQAEIQASLERAKLSRERQEVAQKQAELEEELIHMRRESRHSKKSEEMGTSRRWLAQLGLTDTN